MESSTICVRCNILTSRSHLFSCNHSLCSQCIARSIAFTHVKTIFTEDQIRIACPCHLGTKTITVAAIPQLLENVFAGSTCKMHGASVKFNCLKCELWLCEDCIAIHKLAISNHQLTQGQSEFKKCDIHEGQISDHYCHDCRAIICPLCTTRKGSKHSTHNYQLIRDYARDLRTKIPIYDIPAEVNRIETLRADFRAQVDNSIEKNMQKMDEIIQLIQESKVIYSEKMKQTLQRAELLLNLLRFCYLDFNNKNVTLDLYLLRDLSTWNIKVEHLRLQAEGEKHAKQLEESFQEYLKMPPIEAMQVAFLKMQTIDAIQSANLNLKDWYKITSTLLGHNGFANSIIQMHDGRMISGSRDKTIKVWEVKDKEYKHSLTLTGHNDWVNSLIQLKDGRIASASYDRTIKIWEMIKRAFQNTLTLTGHDDSVFSLLQLKDGKIASGSYDNTIKLWEVKETEFKNTLTLIGHEGGVWSLIQMKDGRIASGSWDKTIKIWEQKEKEFTNTLNLTGHKGSVSSLIQMKDGRIASGSWDKTIKIWGEKELPFQNIMTLFGHNGDVYSLIQMKDERIASGSFDYTIKIWEVKEKEFKNTVTLSGHDGPVCSLIQLEDGRIVSGSADKTIKIWD